jgi:hypothetical protein
VTALQWRAQLDAVAALAERLLREDNPIGVELANIVTSRQTSAPSVEQCCMLELAVWSRYYSAELGAERLASLVLGELVCLYMDQDGTRDSLSGAVERGWNSVAAARVELGVDEIAR